jgi:dipeptidyl-peptidase-4
MKHIIRTLILTFFSVQLFAQIPDTFQWLPDGSGYRDVSDNGIVEISLPTMQEKVLVSNAQLKNGDAPLAVRSYTISNAGDKVLIYTNTKRVWRYDTRGDYWVFDIASKTLKQLGKGLPASSLMFAKFSPDGKKAGYVSQHNVYAEDLQSGEITQLTKDGTDRVINGTFDWVYEEEFDCRDGFRWSDDSKSVAYWQLDARKIRNFLMINTTDSIYSFNVPVEYPKVGETPSPYKIGVVDVATAQTKWMNIPGDPQNTYLPRMEWSGMPDELVVQQLNRKQNESTLLYINTREGSAKPFYTEKDAAWIDIKSRWEDDPMGWDWINNGKEFLWVSEKDGWRHTYRVSRDGKKETLITAGNFDMISPVRIDEKNNAYYFMASPDNATQSYFYKVSLDGKGKAERLTPADQAGTHVYEISPAAKFAQHRFSNAKTSPLTEWVALPKHTAIDPENSIAKSASKINSGNINIEFFKVKTAEGVEVDAWMVKPTNFDPAKKYPIVFTGLRRSSRKYCKGCLRNGTQPVVRRKHGRRRIHLRFYGQQRYSVTERKCLAKSDLQGIGVINIKDMDGAATAMFKQYPFIDTSRVAVHGWSGGGSSTLNLLFQYPEHFKTGIAVAAVANQLTYDNIYQERYMGIPQENREDFVKGSPITYAKNLRGNLLYIHGTGDDNVHYQNAEMLVNELIKNNKVFQFMPYPNRSHGIYEGEGTSLHLKTLFTDYLKKNCPPGGK